MVLPTLVGAIMTCLLDIGVGQFEIVLICQFGKVSLNYSNLVYNFYKLFIWPNQALRELNHLTKRC